MRNLALLGSCGGLLVLVLARVGAGCGAGASSAVADGGAQADAGQVGTDAAAESAAPRSSVPGGCAAGLGLLRRIQSVLHVLRPAGAESAAGADRVGGLSGEPHELSRPGVQASRARAGGIHGHRACVVGDAKASGVRLLLAIGNRDRAMYIEQDLDGPVRSAVSMARALSTTNPTATHHGFRVVDATDGGVQSYLGGGVIAATEGALWPDLVYKFGDWQDHSVFIGDALRLPRRGPGLQPLAPRLVRNRPTAHSFGDHPERRAA